MPPEVNSTYLSRKVWQTVSAYVLKSISGRELCPERSRIENLRPVLAIDEDEYQFGRQIWYFEVLGVTPSGRRQTSFGVIELSIQFGFFEPKLSVFFEESVDRERYFVQLTNHVPEDPILRFSTRFWIWAAWSSIAILSGGWLIALFRHLATAPLNVSG